MAADKSKRESLERLQQQFYQAQTDGNTRLMKLIKAVIDRVKDENSKSQRKTR